MVLRHSLSDILPQSSSKLIYFRRIPFRHFQVFATTVEVNQPAELVINRIKVPILKLSITAFAAPYSFLIRKYLRTAANLCRIKMMPVCGLIFSAKEAIALYLSPMPHLAPVGAIKLPFLAYRKWLRAIQTFSTAWHLFLRKASCNARPIIAVFIYSFKFLNGLCRLEYPFMGTSRLRPIASTMQYKPHIGRWKAYTHIPSSLPMPVKIGWGGEKLLTFGALAHS